MALVATVTKKSVSESMLDLFNITLNMVLVDGVDEVINRDYSVRYRPGDSISAKQTALYKMMHEDIQKYESEKQIFDAAALNTVVANVEAALNE